MKLSELKNTLSNCSSLVFELPNGTKVPSHFHITEVGEVSKKFVDCGGTVRTEKYISLQLWQSNDTWHKLTPQKLLAIISLSENEIQIGNYEVVVEYQTDTIGSFGLSYEDGKFILNKKNTACLATNECGINTHEKLNETSKASCTPGGGCC